MSAGCTNSAAPAAAAPAPEMPAGGRKYLDDGCTAGCTVVQYGALLVVDGEEEFYLEEAVVEAV